MILKDKLKHFFSVDQNVAEYRQAMSLLRRTGILNLLREIGVPAQIGNGSDVQATAYQGAWSNGYYTCLRDLEAFEEMFNKREVNSNVPMDFGGNKRILKEGWLTEQELKGDKK